MFIHYSSVSALVKDRENFIKIVCDEYMRDWGLPYDLALIKAEEEYKIKLETMSGRSGVKQAKLKESNNKSFNKTINLEKAKECKTKLSSMTYVDCDGRVFESADAFCKHYRIRIGQFRYLKEQRGLSVSRISELVNEGKIQHIS